MKRLVFCILFVLSTHHLFGQQEYTYSTYLTLHHSPVFSWNAELGTGILLPVWFYDRWAVRAGVEYQRLKFTGSKEIDILKNSGTYRIVSNPGHYLMVLFQPTKKYSMNPLVDMKLFINLGIVSVWTGDHLVYLKSSDEKDGKDSLHYTIKSDQQTGLHIGTGILLSILLTDRVELYGGLRFLLQPSFEKTRSLPTGPIGANYTIGFTF